MYTKLFVSSNIPRITQLTVYQLHAEKKNKNKKENKKLNNLSNYSFTCRVRSEWIRSKEKITGKFPVIALFNIFLENNSHEERRDSIGLTSLGEKILWVLLMLANYFKALFNSSVAPY